MLRFRSPDVLLLLIVALTAGWMGRGHLTLEVDAENLAMKSDDSSSQRADDLRREVFGDEPTVLLLVQPMAVSSWRESDQRSLEAWGDSLGQWEEVSSVRRLPVGLEAGALLAIVPSLSPGGRYAESTASFLQRAQEEVPLGVRASISGQPAVEVVLAKELVREQSRVVPILIGALFLFLLLVYRHLSPALGALLAPLSGVAILGGIEALLGIKLDPVSCLLSPAVLTVGVAASIHVVEGVRRLRTEGLDIDAATRMARKRLLRPFLLTATTTMGGFLGLLTSPIPAVRRFGWLASLGVALTTVLTLTALPAFLRIFGCPPRRPRLVHGRGSSVVALVIQRGARRIVGATLVVALVFAWGWTRIRVDTNPLELLPDQHSLRQDTVRIAKAVGSIDCIDLMLSPPHPKGGFLRVGSLVARLNQVEGLAGPCGPPRRAESGEILVPILLAPGGAAARIASAEAAVRVAQDLGWPQAVASGLALRVAEDSERLVSAQLRGLLVTLILLWSVMAIGFRSLWLATVGLAPNILPCLLIYGGLSLSGHPLSVASALIGTVMLGLIVDDTIHLLHAFRLQRKRGRGIVSSVARALSTITRPITVTSFCLIVGFATTMLGQLATTREFGALAVATVLAALAADLLVLPALLSLGRPDNHQFA